MTVDKDNLRPLIADAIREILGAGTSHGAYAAEEADCLPDLAEIDISKKVYVPHPAKPEQLLNMRAATPARIGVWRAGTRYLTETQLRFLADHAAARDAVHKETPERLLAAVNMPVVQTECRDKDEYLTRPDLGRRLTEESREIVKKLNHGTRALVFFADGLSTTAIDANGADAYLSLTAGLKSKGISYGVPFLVKYGRVPVEDVVAELTEAEIVVLLVGERPGLATSESMSAYMAYSATAGMDESRRTVVSNIHKNGTPAVEAGAYIADIVQIMLEKKCSGVELKL